MTVSPSRTWTQAADLLVPRYGVKALQRILRVNAELKQSLITKLRALGAIEFRECEN